MGDKRRIVVVPTYNEAENVRRLLPEIRASVNDVDVLVVDDSSPDGTGDIVKELAEGNPWISLLSRKGKEGLGKAYVAGFKECLSRNYDVIIQMDCDFSHQPKYLPVFLEALNDADLVLGSRYLKGGGTENWGLHRQFLSRGGNLYARTILGLPYSDLTGGFKCWSREVLSAIDLDTVSAAGYAFQMEMTFRAHRKGFRVKEVPIVFPDRTAGESKLAGDIFWESLKMPWRLRYGQNRPR